MVAYTHVVVVVVADVGRESTLVDRRVGCGYRVAGAGSGRAVVDAAVEAVVVEVVVVEVVVAEAVVVEAVVVEVVAVAEHKSVASESNGHNCWDPGIQLLQQQVSG